MMQIDESREMQDTATGGAEDKACPSSPSPEGYVAPRIESEDYHGKLTKFQREMLDSAREEKYADAEERKKALLILAEERERTARGAYEAAMRKAESELHLLDMQTLNKKRKMHADYRKSLRDILPKNCVPADDTDIESDDKIPKDQKAVKIAELQQKLAIEEIDYLGKVLDIQRNESLAESNWKLAEEQRDSDLCMAEATEERARRDADVDWRIAVSKALEETKR